MIALPRLLRCRVSGLLRLLRTPPGRELIEQAERLPAGQVLIQRVGSFPFSLHDEETARRATAFDGLKVDVALAKRAPDGARGRAANDRRVGHQQRIRE